MTEEAFDMSNAPRVTHYHGDFVRVLFVSAAIILFLTQITGAEVPFSPGFVLFVVLVLVIAAGITNPAYKWIHWINTFFAAFGVLLFGGIALSRLNNGMALLTHSGLIVLLSIIFLIALYFSTRTLRAQLTGTVLVDEDEQSG